MSKDSSRYPYTYAADYLRAFAGYGPEGTKCSRADASQIRQAIARALGMEDSALAEKLADYYLANEQAVTDHSVAEFTRDTLPRL